MYEFIANKEFGNTGKKLAVTCNMFIKVDEENMIITASDIIDHKYIDTASNGILKEVNAHIAAKIEDKLGINIIDYGVEICDECVSVSREEIEDVT